MAVRSLAQQSLISPTSNNSMLAGYQTNMFHHLETIRLASSASSVEFTNLGQYFDFQHLQIRATTRVTAATTLRMSEMRFNGDTGANYSTHILIGEGSGSPYSAAGVSTNQMLCFYGTGASNPSGAFGAGVIDILDPFETSKYTTIRTFGGQTGYNIMGLSSGSWRNTAALTSITIFNQVANDFATGSRFSLYGLKARA